MKSRERTGPTTLDQTDRVSAPQRMVEAGVLQCLVSSASRTRRNLISQAATDAGWDAVVCTAPDEASDALKRNAFHFAMVDLDDCGQTPTGARELVQTLIADSRRILVGVCGHEADPDEEIWARQLGIWLYLPGVTTSSEVAMLCEQALQIVNAERQKEKNVSAP